MNTVENNLSELRNEIAPYTPTIIAVTKYFDENKLIEAYNAGLRDFGENRVQDALEKFAKLPNEIRETSRFHLIGHLQTNKVKKAVGQFDLIHSVDSYKLASLISEEANKKNIVQKVLLQVNNANEINKSGFAVDELEVVFPELLKLSNIKIDGLMNIAPITSEDELHILFEDIRRLQQRMHEKYQVELKELSMGMSNDYQIALQHGATIIRIGRKLFT